MSDQRIGRLWRRLAAICAEMADVYDPQENPVRKAPTRRAVAQREVPPERRARARDCLARAGYQLVPWDHERETTET